MGIQREMLGAAIKQVRLLRGMTQVELAEAAGLSKSGNSVALIEQGKRFVSVQSLNALADALDVPAACLAILGSQKIGTNKAASDFLGSLQRVISTVIHAQAATSTIAESEPDKAVAAPVSKPRSSKAGRTTAQLMAK